MRCGKSGNAQYGTCCHIQAFRHQDSLFRRQGDRLRSCTEWALPLAVPDPDTLAKSRRINPLPHLDNHTGPVAMWHNCGIRKFANARPRAGPRFDIRGVHARIVQIHPHLARTSGHVCVLFHRQDRFGWTKLSVSDGFHRDLRGDRIGSGFTTGNRRPHKGATPVRPIFGSNRTFAGKRAAYQLSDIRQEPRQPVARGSILCQRGHWRPHSHADSS